jgi:hypothetical protein
MQYANANDVTTNCARCGKPIANHKFNLIESSKDTDDKALKVFGQLDAVLQRGKKKGFQTPAEQTMVGVAIAEFKSSSQVYATLSGPGVALLKHIKKDCIGKEAILASDSVNLLVDKDKKQADKSIHYSLIDKTKLGYQCAKVGHEENVRRGQETVKAWTDYYLPDIGGRLFQPILLYEWVKVKEGQKWEWYIKLDNKNERVVALEYRPGGCAAQKLLIEISKHPKIGELKKITMSEVLWRGQGPRAASATSRQWKKGETAQSCRTCKQIVPQMLCDLWDAENK